MWLCYQRIYHDVTLKLSFFYYFGNVLVLIFGKQANNGYEGSERWKCTRRTTNMEQASEKYEAGEWWKRIDDELLERKTSYR
jgi:hypothetical protein